MHRPHRARARARFDQLKREKTMRKLAQLIGLATLSMPALAATAQQEKMKKCSAEDKGLEGEEYKRSHNACLKS